MHVKDIVTAKPITVDPEMPTLEARRPDQGAAAFLGKPARFGRAG